MDDEAPERVQIVLAVSDQAELRPLAQWLESERDVTVRRVPGDPGLGEQGVLDVSTYAGTSALVSAIRVLPDFLRSRRTGLQVTVTIADQAFTLEAGSIDVLPALQRVLVDWAQPFSPPPGPPLDDDIYES
jgi:hypothetical protein